MASSSWRVGAVATLLVCSGGLTVAASAQRWWPACLPGKFDSGDCPRLQDHAYDFVIPGAPWTPVGDAAELYGVGLVLLAAAVVLAPRMLLGRSSVLFTLGGCVVALGVLAVGVATFLSGHTGTVVSEPGVGGTLWALGLPLLAVACLVDCVLTEPPGTRWRMAVTFALLMSTPIPGFVVPQMLLGYTSYDTTPWTEAFGGAALVVAGVLLLPALRARPSTATSRRPVPRVGGIGR